MAGGFETHLTALPVTWVWTQVTNNKNEAPDESEATRWVHLEERGGGVKGLGREMREARAPDRGVALDLLR